MTIKNYDEWIETNHNPNLLYIFDHPSRILIIGDSGSGKTNVSLNLLKHQQPIIDKICLYVKDLFKSKYKLLFKRREKVGSKEPKNPKALTDYSQTFDDVNENLEAYNPIKKRKVFNIWWYDSRYGS